MNGQTYFSLNFLIPVILPKTEPVHFSPLSLFIFPLCHMPYASFNGKKKKFNN